MIDFKKYLIPVIESITDSPGEKISIEFFNKEWNVTRYINKNNCMVADEAVINEFDEFVGKMNEYSLKILPEFLQREKAAAEELARTGFYPWDIEFKSIKDISGFIVTDLHMFVEKDFIRGFKVAGKDGLNGEEGWSIYFENKNSQYKIRMKPVMTISDYNIFIGSYKNFP